MSTGISDPEEAMGTLNTIVEETPPGVLIPSKYAKSDVEELAVMTRKHLARYESALYGYLPLDDRQAATVAMVDSGLSKPATALTLSLATDFEGSVETVQEDLNAAREIYIDGALIYEFLDDLFFNYDAECPRCSAVIDLSEFIAPPMECPSCEYEDFLFEAPPV